MNVEELKEIIKDQREGIDEALKREKIIERSIEAKNLLNFLEHPNILAILGVRRCGKSMLSNLVLKNKKYGYVNFDDERLADIKTEDLNRLLQAFYEIYGSDLEHIILDEIQNVPNWELFATRLRNTKKLILTGSNAKLLSGELATRLSGRHMDFTLYPFSFDEFLKMKDIRIEKEDFYSTRKRAEIKSSLRDYLSVGAFPEVHKFGRTIVPIIYGDIIEKDVIMRGKIRNKAAIRELAKYLISNPSREVTYTKLKNILSIKKVHTIKNYVDYLSSAYLIFILERFSFKLKEQMIAPKKAYCIDTGVINSVGFGISKDFGRLMENLAAIELFRRKSYWLGEWGIFYWKDYQQNEVDFVVKAGFVVKQLIQVTYASSKEEVEKREIKSLLKASEALRCKNLLVITWDFEGREEIEGKEIIFIPLWKWLLSPVRSTNCH